MLEVAPAFHLRLWENLELSHEVETRSVWQIWFALVVRYTDLVDHHVEDNVQDRGQCPHTTGIVRWNCASEVRDPYDCAPRHRCHLLWFCKTPHESQ